ncbi:MAG TPA: hypothetical protein VG983_08425 [Caulobacterales bacterium]|jgi:hypothetical protein|nr:hypothetical protein [Caulobacterales bacterium]
MSQFPIAETPEQALEADRPAARTAEEAEARVGGPVYLASAELPEAFATITDADEFLGGALYGDPKFEAVWRGDAWRVMVRFWRPAPPAPVARTAAIAARKPLGFARTPAEAQKILGAPAERASERLGGAYATRARALGRATALVEHGHAEIVEREGRFMVMLTFWRPLASKLAPAERAELEARAAAPMRPGVPQANMYIGMFEQLAPENSSIVLVDEEGDGRTHGE